MKRQIGKDAVFNIIVTVAIVAIMFIIQSVFPQSSTIVNVCKKTCIYALAAVAMTK